MRRMLFALLLSMLAAMVFVSVALAKPIDGTGEPDTIIGTPQADLIKGLSDIDRVYAIGGDDVVYGNAGGDRLVGDNLPEAVREEQGFTGEIGLPGDDELFGGKGADRLFGNEGDDILNAGQEDTARYDELTGGRGEVGGTDVFWVDDHSFQAYAQGRIPNHKNADVILDLQEGEEIHNVDVEGAAPIIWPPS